MSIFWELREQAKREYTVTPLGRNKIFVRAYLENAPCTIH